MILQSGRPIEGQLTEAALEQVRRHKMPEKHSLICSKSNLLHGQSQYYLVALFLSDSFVDQDPFGSALYLKVPK